MIRISGFYRIARIPLDVVRSWNKPKIFCIGRNKTGTTSLAKALEEMGFIVALQRPAEYLIKDWIKGRFRRLKLYCMTARAFADAPFSFPGTFEVMDKAFPGSKFILTIRNSPETWYDSIVRAHSKNWGHGKLPDKEDLLNARTIFKGYAWLMMKSLYHIPDNDPYNKEILINHYKNHNRAIMEYFKDRPDDLLVLNVTEDGAYQKLCGFLGVKSEKTVFPWENKS